MHACDSKAIEQYDYDPEAKVLKVEMKSGSTYHYQNVPQEDFDAFHASGSKGGHFHKHIRNAFKFEKT